MTDYILLKCAEGAINSIKKPIRHNTWVAKIYFSKTRYIYTDRWPLVTQLFTDKVTIQLAPGTIIYDEQYNQLKTASTTVTITEVTFIENVFGYL